MSMETRSRETTRQRVMEAGFEVFATEGIGRATIGAICERAGFTRGAFYSNFASKEELFMDLYRGEIRARAERLQHSFASARSVIGGMPRSFSARWLTELVLDSFTLEHERDEKWFLMTSEAHVIGMRDPELGRQLAEARNDLLDGITAVIGRQLAEHHLSLNMPVRDAVLVVVDLYEATLTSSMLTGSFVTARATSAALIPRLIDSIVRVHQEPSH